MPKSYKDILPILEEIKKDLADMLKTNNFELIVFGSYARGEAREDSDLDLLLLVDKKISWEEEHKIIEELVEKYLKKKILISIIIKERNERIDSILLENIKREGVTI